MSGKKGAVMRTITIRYSFFWYGETSAGNIYAIKDRKARRGQQEVFTGLSFADARDTTDRLNSNELSERDYTVQ